MPEKLVSVEHLSKTFAVGSGFGKSTDTVTAVDDVSFHLFKGETLGIVGESGCGKSTLARMITRLIDPTLGTIRFKGEDITKVRGRALRIKRSQFQMVFQDPYASLNPRMRIRRILEEPLRAQKIPKGTWRKRMDDALEQVGVPQSFLQRYAHELSGGQRQRIGIARALILEPELLVADEPVAALDVSIQAQVLNLMKDLQQARGLTCMFIAHDLSVVQYVSDRIGVMYLGQLVELAPGAALYRKPLHPYTQLLMKVVPLPDPSKRKGRAQAIGELPSPIHRPQGCPFHTRCPLVQDICRRERPPLREIEKDRHTACHFAEQLQEP